MRALVLVLAALLLTACSLYAQQSENVFIVVIDGARYTETFGDVTHQYVPKIWNQLRPLGTIYTSFYIDGSTTTNPGHSSILTGTWQYIANDGTERPHMPTLFEYFRKELGASAAENYVVLGKDKLNILSYSDYAGYGSTYGASVQTSTSQYDDVTTWNNIKTVITADHPRLMIVNMSQTDNAGHSGVWASYVSGIQRADSLVCELWTLIQSDMVYQNKTTLFVTNDHGRHTANFSSHGDACEGCRHIMLLTIGPDTPAGAADSSMRKQIDIAPTVGYLLKFGTPYTTGSILNSAVISVAAVPGQGLRRTADLSQNYPNPFSSATTIGYFSDRPSDAHITIFDSLGRLVRRLTAGQQPAGLHNTVWDGMDEDGRRVSSGIYFYVLDTPDGLTVSKRMLMLR